MRNGVRVEEDSNHMTSQIIVDTSANTVYNNTLRVRGREPGEYECDVRSNYQQFFPDSNPGRSMATSNLVIRGKAMQTKFLLSHRHSNYLRAVSLLENFAVSTSVFFFVLCCVF